jgi:hypothetical protein
LIVLVKFLSADCDSRELAIPGTVEQLEAARALGDCLLRVAEVQGKRMLAEQAARELRDRAFTGAP